MTHIQDVDPARAALHVRPRPAIAEPALEPLPPVSVPGDALPLEEVLVTGRLATRTARTPDHAAETRALHAIARAMNRSPAAALDALLHEALVLCQPGGDATSGVSLIETDAATGRHQFRWTALAGRLAAAVGGTTPIDFSPCGVCLAHGHPVLFARPDLHFTYFLASGAPFVEGLVLPFSIGGTVAGTIWVVSHDDTRPFDAEDVRVMTSLAEFAGAAYAMLDARETAERARAEAEAANRAKSDFLAMMSHELRTPLNAIGGYAALMAMEIRGPVTPQQQEDLRRIQQSQQHLLGLINEVLSYAQLETGSVVYDVVDLPLCEALAGAEALVAPQAQAKALTLAVEPCPPTLAVRADAERLRQILANLLSNAIKFTGPRGCVELSCAVDGDVVAIRVRDTGIGIPPEKLEAIFEPFVQVRGELTRPHEGTGLGLAISRDLARGMGGDLVAASAPGVGSLFTLTLPRA